MDRDSLTGPAIATLALLVPLAVLDRRMQSAGGTGIIPFELAGPGRSDEILRAWGVDGQRSARASLLLDFPYLVAYTTLNVRLTRRASERVTEDDGVQKRSPHSSRPSKSPLVCATQSRTQPCSA
jgi:hypothetical protein